jgi:hypothetical protein
MVVEDLGDPTDNLPQGADSVGALAVMQDLRGRLQVYCLGRGASGQPIALWTKQEGTDGHWATAWHATDEDTTHGRSNIWRNPDGSVSVRLWLDASTQAKSYEWAKIRYTTRGQLLGFETFRPALIAKDAPGNLQIIGGRPDGTGGCTYDDPRPYVVLEGDAGEQKENPLPPVCSWSARWVDPPGGPPPATIIVTLYEAKH